AIPTSAASNSCSPPSQRSARTASATSRSTTSAISDRTTMPGWRLQARRSPDSPDHRGTAMITLSGKTALITGAAGGIARALSAPFADLGATVTAPDRDQHRLADFAAASAAKNVRLQPLPVDITDEKAVAAGLKEAVAAAGDPTILVN